MNHSSARQLVMDTVHARPFVVRCTDPAYLDDLIQVLDEVENGGDPWELCRGLRDRWDGRCRDGV